MSVKMYNLEFILHTQNASSETIKNSLVEFGQDLEITDSRETYGRGKSFRVYINTEDPTIIFDLCSQFGRIKSVKINEGIT